LSESFEILEKKYGDTNNICNYLRIIKYNLEKLNITLYNIHTIFNKTVSNKNSFFLAPKKRKKLKKQLVIHKYNIIKK